MSRLVLQVGAQRYDGWKAVRLGYGIEQLAGHFDITCADRWALQGLPLPKLRGESCTLLLQDEPIITGFIDDAPPSYDRGTHDLALRGRDATGDLVDCSAWVDGQGWQGRSLRQIAVALVKPFEIRVIVDPASAKDADQPFQYQQLQLGESIHEALQRLARMRGLLLISDGLGNLVITGPGSQRCTTPLVLGENVLKAQPVCSDRERYRTYRVVSQARESDFDARDTAQQVLGEATDLGVKRNRLLVIDPVDAADTGSARRLAAWKCAQHAARGDRVTYTVRGWLDAGKPWKPNRVVTVSDRWARFEGEYLLVGVSPRIDNSEGEVVDLEVAPKDAYKPFKTREVAPDAGGAL